MTWASILCFTLAGFVALGTLAWAADRAVRWWTSRP